jgi:Cytochrome oxidase complex assembly protein 1
MANGGGAPRGPGGGWLRDLTRLPFRQFSIDTELSEAEVVERLRVIVEPGNLFLAGLRRTNKPFAGEISPEGFKIARLIHYRNGSLPVLIGRFEPGPRGARVQITTRLMRFTQVFLALWFGFLLFIFVIAAVASLESMFSFQKPGFGWPLTGVGLAIGMGLFGYLIVTAPFGLEARKAQGLLEEALQATPGPRIQKILLGAPPRLPRIAKRLLLGAGALATGIVVLSVFSRLLIGRTEPYHIAENFVRTDPIIQGELGPIRGVDLELMGNSVRRAGSEGSARFAFEVEGARSGGVVIVAMRKHLGMWHISTADLREPSGRIITLQADAAATAAPSP